MTRLPLLVRVLLHGIDPRLREFVAGDLEEAHAAMTAANGPLAACRWATRQALAAVITHPWQPSRRQRGDGFMRFRH